MTRPVSTIYHDPIIYNPKQPADSDIVNRPDNELDAAIGVVELKVDKLLQLNPPPCDGAITRDEDGYIIEIELDDGITVTINRDENHLITSIDNTITTWTFTRDESNRIISWIIVDD